MVYRMRSISFVSLGVRRAGRTQTQLSCNSAVEDHILLLGNIANLAGRRPALAATLGDAKFLDHQYTAFGKLIKGDDVLGKLGDAETLARGGEKSKPVTRQGVESIKIVPADSIK